MSALETRDSIKEKFDLIVQSCIDPAFLIDAHGSILDMNDEAVTVFAINRPEIQGHDLFRTILPIDLLEAYKASLQLYDRSRDATDLIRRVEVSIPTTRKGNASVELSIAPLSIDGKSYFNVCIRDLSNTRALEHETSQFVNQSQDLICLARIDGAFLKVNSAFTAVLGYSESELLQLPLLELVHPEDKEATRIECNKLIDGIPAISFENRCRCKDGAYKWLSWKTTYDPVSGLVYAVARDVTERRKLTKRLKATAKDFADIKYALDQAAIVAITDNKGIIEYVNDKFCQISGYSEDELLGQDHRIINSGYHPKKFIKDLWKTITAGHVWRAEIRNKAKDGSIYWVDTTIVPLLSSNGKSSQYISIRYDITEKKRLEERIVRTNALQKAILDSTQYSIIAINKDGLITAFNKGAEALLGYREEDLVELEDLSKIHDFEEVKKRSEQLSRELGRDIKPGRETFTAIAEKGESDTNEWTYINKDGQRIPVLLTVTPLRDENNEINGYVGIARDITHEKLAEKRKLMYMREIESINKELDDFAYIISHDLKAPLRAIGSLTEWIFEDNYEQLGAEGREHLQLLKSRVERMSSLIDGVLRYSRAGREKVAREAVDLDLLVRNVLDSLLMDANVSVSIPRKLPTVHCSAVRMNQVFQNLISNAIKYNDKEHIEVEIAYNFDGEMHKFEIRDNGPGIEERYHEKIFQLFQTLQSRDSIESTGVGLSLAKKIVEMHGGTLKVESEMGKGTTFIFTLEDSNP